MLHFYMLDFRGPFRRGSMQRNTDKLSATARKGFQHKLSSVRFAVQSALSCVPASLRPLCTTPCPSHISPALCNPHSSLHLTSSTTSATYTTTTTSASSYTLHSLTSASSHIRHPFPILCSPPTGETQSRRSGRRAAPERGVPPRQGLTLVHLSAHLEP
jgi:hypothetical protein